MAKALRPEELQRHMDRLQIDEWRNLRRRAYEQEEKFYLHSSVAERIHLAKALAKLVHRDQTLLHFDEWGIWDDIPGVHRRLRQSAGIDLAVWECDSELVGEDEADYLTSIFFMVLSFGWDAYAIDIERQIGVYISHDSWFAPIGAADYIQYFAAEFDYLPRFLGWQVEEE